MPVRFRDLVERRIPHVLAIYLGAGWGLIEFITFLEQRIALNPNWTNLVVLAWLLLVPSVLLFTWNHGLPGRDVWVRSEKIGIPLNVVITIAVLSTAFGGADLSATTHRVTVTDETGATVERTVAKSAFRKRLALFFFDAAPADTAAAWLREGGPLALSMDLAQDLFIDARVPQYFREQLRERGNSTGYNVPLTLKQQIAREMHLPYFVAGKAASGADGYMVTTFLYETSTGKLIKERTATNADVFAAIDQLSVQLKQDLDLPAIRGAQMQDLPVAELLSPNVAAVRAVAEGQAALMSDDWQTAVSAFARATRLDPTFAFAHLAEYQTRTLSGDATTAMASMAKAMQHLHRLPERAQFGVKVENYIMQRQMDMAFSVATMMVELYPDDVSGQLLSAQLYLYRQQRGKAIASLRRVLELDPQQQEYLLQIAQLQEQEGAPEDALQTYVEYTKRNPTDAAAHLQAAHVQQRLGRLSGARASVEQALVVDPLSVEAKVALASLARSAGDLNGALRQLRETLATTTTAEDSMRVLSGLQSYYEGGGQLREAVRVVTQRVAIAPRFMAPIQVLGLHWSSMAVLVRAGQRAQAEATLAHTRAQLNAPLDDFWYQGDLRIALETRDSMRLKQSGDALRRIMDGFGMKFIEPAILKGEAMLREVRGDWTGAAQTYERINQLEPTDVAVNRDIARCYRMLGRFDDAQRAVDRHLRAAPYSAESNLEAARIKLARNDAAGARPHLERAAQVLANADPGYAPAAEVKQLLTQSNAR